MSAASVKDIQRALKTIGWPLAVDGERGFWTIKAVTDFQRMCWIWGYRDLKVDGTVGPKETSDTWKAIQKALDNGGKCSVHFRFREFASRRTGWPSVHRQQVRAMEAYRKKVDHPVYIISAFREYIPPGGASNSQHGVATGKKYGTACDFTPEITVAQAKALKVWSGIGYAKNGRVCHGDCRHVGNNTTGGTVANPTTWQYPW